MKKIYLFLILSVITVSVSHAQFKFGIKGGGNVATLVGDVEVDPILGFHLGAYAHIGFTNNFGIQSELLYSTQGDKYDFVDNNFLTVNAKDRLNYLNIPVLLKLQTNSGITFEGGGQFGFLLMSKITYDIENNNSGVTYDDYENKEYLNPVDFGLVLGAGYELASGININLRAIFGVTNVNDPEKIPDSEEVSNLVGQLSIGFPLFAM